MSTTISLKDRQADSTQKLILSTALELLESEGVNGTTARAVAKKAGISERTIFRYYSSREEFLDALASEASSKIQAPPPPERIEDLVEYVSSLYETFERSAPLLRESLHTEISKRLRASVGRGRWVGIRDLIDRYAPHRSAADRKIAATNISYYLSGTTWFYYRSVFDLSAKDAERFARSAVALFVKDIRKKE
jgi:AcrR family transcriptional regulator